MAEIPDWLPRGTVVLIEQTVALLADTLKQDLVSAFLVGAAMNPARQDRGRAPEIIAVTSDRGAQGLATLAAALRKVMADGTRVRLLTEQELCGSCDVFALEIAEWQARHRLLHGKDVLAGLSVRPADLRRSLETELRGLSRRLRNRVLLGLNTRRDDPRHAVLNGIDRLVVISHHALQLLGTTPPTEEDALLRGLAERAGADAAPLLRQVAEVRIGTGRIDPMALLEALLQVVAPATHLIDKLVVPE